VNLVVRSDQRADRRALHADGQVAFPVPRHRPVLGFGRAGAEQHVLGDMRPRFLQGPSPRDPQRAPGSQAGDQLAGERAAALDVEGLVDRLVADPHRLIVGELDR
jgi:hypothetical protein